VDNIMARDAGEPI